jgi:hypothetical protein
MLNGACRALLDKAASTGTRRREFVNQCLADPRRILGCVHEYSHLCGQTQLSRSLDIWTRFTLGSRMASGDVPQPLPEVLALRGQQIGQAARIDQFVERAQVMRR